MSLKNYAYYNKVTGMIENVILIEDTVFPTLSWSEDYSAVEINANLEGEWSTCGIGWSYIDGMFVEPPKPPEPEQPTVEGAQTL